MTEQPQTRETPKTPETPVAVPEERIATAPPLPVAAPEFPPPLPEAAPDVPPPARKDRRALRAVLRWTAAVVVCAAVGVTVAYGITGVERTDVPGLATEPDGRWAYPELTRPALPAGSPAPFDEANTTGSHHADLRELLLPEPEGATTDRRLAGTDGWLDRADFLAEFEEESDRDEIEQDLTDHGLRHIAARGWTTGDGTHTRIYLLRFNTAEVVDRLANDGMRAFSSPGHAVRDAGDAVYDEDFPTDSSVENVARYVYVENEPYGSQQLRQAYLSAGDVFAVILQSRAGGADAVPFQQTVVLQSQLLG